jgi:hypothetical protein
MHIQYQRVFLGCLHHAGRRGDSYGLASQRFAVPILPPFDGAIVDVDRAPVYFFATGSSFDIDGLRQRLARMDDATLERFGLSAAYLCSPGPTWANHPATYS